MMRIVVHIHAAVLMLMIRKTVGKMITRDTTLMQVMVMAASEAKVMDAPEVRVTDA
jgi:hypothetical protein